MEKYTVTVPYQRDMGRAFQYIAVASPKETAEHNALWSFNLLREYEGLAPLLRLPSGTTLERTGDE